MKRTALAVLAASAVAVLATVTVTRAGGKDRVERGRVLVSSGGCNDCHTPLVMGANGPGLDLARMLSGHPEALVMPPAPPAEGPWAYAVAATNTAWAGPWGVSFTANLTPDAETGIGSWTEEEFVQTLRSGRHLGRGRQLLPPMPFQNFRDLADEDLKAIFAYLRSIPAVRNRVPSPRPPALAAR